MAGSKEGGFAELVSPFLRKKIADSTAIFGSDSTEAAALTRQYLYDEREALVLDNERRRHYESEVLVYFENRPVVGVERLYRRTILIEPTTVCAAHCRWCLRGQYPVRTMKEDEIVHATRYIGSEGLRDDIDEVLITGGDPLMSQPLLALTLSELERNASNVHTVRIGSRVIFQDPRRINANLMAIFARYPNFRFEIGVNVNHPIEFWPEATEALARVRDAGIRLYNQHPLLKGVNDNLPTLVDLYGFLREHGIEAHYLFHAIPLRGMSHHRTSLRKGANLVAKLSSCGEFSGRAKPKYAVLSDIGKIVIYDGVVLAHREDDNALLLQSGFSLEDRQRWVPNWRLPSSVEVDEDGLMRTWYLDGTDLAA
jgi:lysine 2,3-aminomutase